METKVNQLINDNVISVNDAIEHMLNGYHEYDFVIDDKDEVDSYNADLPNSLHYLQKNVELCNRYKKWYMPEEYYTYDVLSYCLDKCNNEDQIRRVCEEYILYEERDLIMLLKYFIFLVDIMRKHCIINGVGRGSSVSSYILFLIGIHRVDSMKYNLDITDFLK